MEKVTRPIFLLTDFGTRDQYTGQVRAVLATLAPASPVHDLTHEVEPFAIDEGAWLLETTIAFLPADAVVLAVVDPGVGGDRLALAVEAAGRVFIGPDNGILSGAFSASDRTHASPAGGNGCRAYEIRPLASSGVAPTFHGRDIFAPAAARVATGLPASVLGPSCAPAHLLPPFAGTLDSSGAVRGSVIHIDRYGSLITTVTGAQAGAAYSVHIGDAVVPGPLRTFGDVAPGELLSHIDSTGFVAIAQNQGSAARSLGIRRGAQVKVVPR